MRRTNWKTVSTLITMIAVAGCSESTIAPLQSSTTTAAQFAPAGRVSPALNTLAGTTTSSSFTVGPQGGVFLVGTNAVVFPKGSICEPATADYASASWDAPCAPLQSTITVNYLTTVVNGRTVVDFQTPLRFVPANDPGHWVWIYMYTPAAIGATDLSKFTIFYSPSVGGPLFDESTTDATMRTYVDTRAGISIRRVKHFSGYTSWGGSCDATVDTSCSGGSSEPVQ